MLLPDRSAGCRQSGQSADRRKGFLYALIEHGSGMTNTGKVREDRNGASGIGLFWQLPLGADVLFFLQA
jgi:hypothetical protein